MNFIEQLNLKTIKYDLTNKFFYKTTKEIPEIKKIILNFGCRTTDIRRLSASLLALELITSKKGKLTTTKKANVVLKIRKGNPIGCKVTIQKKPMFNFLEKVLINVFPNIKNFTGIKFNKQITNKSFSYQLRDTFNFSELEEHYYLFNNLPSLNITIVTNSKTKGELMFVIKSFQFPIVNKLIKSRYNSIGRV